MTRRREAGFTLVELLTVVAIIGILAASAVIVTRGDRAAEAARQVSGVLGEARRHAVSTGAVRSDVLATNYVGAPARSRVVFSTVSGRSVVRLDDLVENPPPANTANWVTVSQVTLPSEVEIYGVSDVSQGDPGGPAPSPLPGAGKIKYYYPNGSCEAMTVFLRKRNKPTDQWRVFVLPLSAIPETFKGW